MQDKKVERILKIYLDHLFEICGDKLDKVILYGSYARGEQNIYSDIDVFVLLKATDDELALIRKKMRPIINDIDWDFDVLLSPVYQNSARYNKYMAASGFYQNIEKEGLRIG